MGAVETLACPAAVVGALPVDLATKLSFLFPSLNHELARHDEDGEVKCEIYG